jgi:hypothetical protein
MSIKLMSAIFETEMADLLYTKDGQERKAKASTAKLVLLAIADHANDYGESSYPGYDKLEIKTALSRQGIADTLDALKFNGLLFVDVAKSRLNTNNYTINLDSFPFLKDESSHLTRTSQATGLEGVKPLDLNHPLTIIKPSSNNHQPEFIPIGSPKEKQALAIFKEHFGKLHGDKEATRWLAIVDVTGIEQAELIAAWAEKREINLINRPTLLDSLETAAKNWQAKQARHPEPPERHYPTVAELEATGAI